MADDFDATPYVRPPILDVPSGVTLGVALLSAMPKPAPEHVKKAAKKVHHDTVALQTVWAKSDAAPTVADRRRADIRIDNAWAILLDRLEAYASLPSDEVPKATRARELIEILSPNGREWLKSPYQAEWAESQKRLKKIDDENLSADVDALAGTEFLLEVRRAHKAYGVALGVTKPSPEVPEVNLADPLRALARSIARYGVAVAGMIDDDPATLAAVRKALRPIDDLRDAQARRNGGGDDAPAPPTATPTTPVPEVK